VAFNADGWLTVIDTASETQPADVRTLILYVPAASPENVEPDCHVLPLSLLYAFTPETETVMLPVLPPLHATSVLLMLDEASDGLGFTATLTEVRDVERQEPNAAST
jgi:hypothetical protein